MDLAAGTLLQRRYRLERRLGSGGAATTYAAFDQVLSQPVAMKVLHQASAELRASIVGELQRLRGLSHPCVGRVHDLGSDTVNGVRVWFLVSALIDGVTLTEYALAEANEDKRWDALQRPACDALAALEFLHRVGTRHADVKPDNVLVTRDGAGVLIDFGCARPLDRKPDLAPSGTPAWMAPELLQGDAVDERADLFAFGKSLLSLPVAYPPSVRALLQRMCGALVSVRPSSAAEVLELLGRTERAVWSPGIRSARLLERDPALTRFDHLLDACVNDVPAPRALLVHGPAGVGRSRLLDEFKWRAQERCDVVLGHARGVSGLRDLLARADADGQLRPTSSTGLVAALDTRNRLADKREPTVLVLDDAHLLSDAEQDTLLGLLRTTPDRGRLLLLLTSVAPLDVSAPTVEHLALQPLSEAGLRAWTARRLSDASVRGLLRATDGLPAQVQHVLDRIAAGELREADLIAANERPADPKPPTGNDELSRIDRVTWLLQTGQTQDAADAMLALLESPLHHPRRLLKTAEALGAHAHDHPKLAQAIAGVALAAGEPKRALSWIARVLRTRPDASLGVDARCLAADAYNQLGSPKNARRQLQRAQVAATPAQRGRVAERLARSLTQQGQHLEATRIASDALAYTEDASVRARLYESLGVAQVYRGEREAAVKALSEAERLHPDNDVRARFRCLSYRAMLDFRTGNPTEAATRYAQALAIAEQQGLADLYVNAALNLGSVSHQLGDFGTILISYERAIELCRALGKQNTRTSLMFNLANLYADIGAFDRAETWLNATEELTRDAGLNTLRPYLLRLRGEILAARGSRDAEAHRHFIDAKAVFLASDSQREVAEVWLELCRLCLAGGDIKRASAHLEQADLCLATLDTDDVIAAARGLRARLLLQQERAGEALSLVESALTIAERRMLRLLAADLHHLAADTHSALASNELAQHHRGQANTLEQRVAATLPPTLRQTFFAHPRRARHNPTTTPAARPIHAATATLVEPEASGVAPPRAFDLSGFLEINRRINSSLSVDQVLSHAMDAAIALTGAERGFLLLRSGDGDPEVDVSVARNVDREHLGKAHIKFSRSIAEEVMRSEEPLLTVDAGSDARFHAQQSVHAMKLKSVVCVPIRSPHGVLGALYLDNRFARARFRQEDVDVLMAFSDQVAIAITNARLHAQLEQRTRELEEERKRVEKLAQGQALEIHRLQGALETQQHALELRHDYSSLVARSGAMREVLSTLDRVTDSNLSVLIQGESGTGKEVVARALHFNGPRRKQPFVSINCGALPEPLLESELFGHVKGAFTGADRDRAGLFVTARGGTLFLDEIGEMSPGMQVKLLRVLQEREVRRVGSSRVENIDVRVLGATNRELQAEVSAGRFREDLYYRLAVVDISLPPLRDRLEDIAELATTLLKRLGDTAQRNVPRLSADALTALQSYAWPGNVRELENVLSRALIMCEGDVITGHDLALDTRRRRLPARDRSTFEQGEAMRLFSALTAHQWNVSAVSRQLGIPRNTLYRKLQRYRLTRDDGH